MLHFYFPVLIKKNYIIKMRNGIKFAIRPKRRKVVGDIDILIEVIMEDQYGINKILKIGHKVIDIGGHVGFFSVLASKIIGKEGKIYVFEPSQSNFSGLIKNLRLNKIKNVIAYNMAVGKLNKKTELFISKDNVGAHSLIRNQNTNSVEVKSTNLKRIFQENHLKRINLLKLDCEGGEYEILLKSPLSVLRKIDTIILEQHLTPYTKKYEEKSIINRLNSIGFYTQTLKKIYYKSEGVFKIILAKRNENHRNSV